ncbi:MAG: hypothetical protein V2J51_12085 [Erythrobacter sp.]|jgi:hypothetical protein|nr:hypothetical protein [Erythrobacter sp.]
MIPSLIIIFGLGIANFALFGAVRAHGYPVLASLPVHARRLGERFALVFEFALLTVVMLLAARGWAGVAHAYAIYTALNATGCWALFRMRR